MLEMPHHGGAGSIGLYLGFQIFFHAEALHFLDRALLATNHGGEFLADKGRKLGKIEHIHLLSVCDKVTIHRASLLIK